MNPVYVLKCDSNGIGVIRSLAKISPEIKIVGVDYNNKAAGLYSRYVKNKIIVPNPALSPETVLSLLVDSAKKEIKKPVLIPTNDHFLNLINKYRNEFEKYFLLNLPEKSLFDTLLNKKCQYELLKKSGIEIPNFIAINSAVQINDINNLTFPVFIKASNPDKWKEHFNLKGFLCEDFKAAQNRIYELLKYGLELIVQEIVTGPNKNHFKVCAYYNKSSKPVAFFVTHKVRQYPVDFGVGTYMKSIHDQTLQDLGKKVFDFIKYTGIGSIEFKKDDRDGKYKLIEINPRIWQQNYQAALAGVNFAEIYYKDCIGSLTEKIYNYKDNFTYIDTVNDFQSFLINRKLTGASILEWIKSFVNADGYAFYDSGDLLPILKSSGYGTVIFRYIKSFPGKIFSK